MAGFTLAQAAGLSAYTVLVAVLVPFISSISSPILTSLIGDIPLPDHPLTDNTGTPKPYTCDATHAYKTEIVSLSPLVIYIHSLITPHEITSLLSTAQPLFKPSTVHKSSSDIHSTERTSSSAGLPRTDPTVQCVLSRARQFLGTMLRDGWDEMGAAQLVRYNAKGQKFDEHHDWFRYPQWSTLPDDDFRKYNRVASFFTILEDQCEGGETWFPYLGEQVFEGSPKGEGAWTGGLGLTVDGVDEERNEKEEGEEEEEKKQRPLWRKHEKGGLAFRPVAGNALFWINLHPENGTGDTRTNHAGLPILDGIKTAMNIWPRQYYEA
ncbi:hypothetical protein QBC37DRAFT_475536 [Rhypophila decipiens]|uniref:Prolyl 4-hydroxylase alpha subunit domain-containing protein n=1 Tax=Rhypophila decipiens TaxID=261697 RepID=A0AAN7B401_9PEZI|nr:hypothetical protein QBC37DRAFT_475536 [Rhypophila decipiens]